MTALVNVHPTSELVLGYESVEPRHTNHIRHIITTGLIWRTPVQARKVQGEITASRVQTGRAFLKYLVDECIKIPPGAQPSYQISR